jgi:Flp pilus assembly protein TadD
MWGLVWLACLALGCATTSASGTPDGERSYREFQLAASLRDEGQTASAIEHLRKALDLDGNNAEAHLLLGFIQMERRDYQNAEEHLSTATLAEARNI